MSTVHEIFQPIVDRAAAGTPNSFDTELDAVMAAKAAARVNGQGYAFAVEWADHWSVEPRKPFFRGTKDGRTTKVLECRDGDGVYLS